MTSPVTPMRYAPRVSLPQRADWYGKPADVGELFRLRKLSCNRQLEAVCLLRTHQFGWECCLLIGGDLMRSEVCRTEQSVVSCSDQWKAAMIEKGWH
jgi:hypothetical protein